MIDVLKGYYVAASFWLVLLNDEDVLGLIENKGYDLRSTARLGRRDGTYYEGLPDLWSAIHAVRGSAGFNLDFLGALLTVCVTWVGDALDRQAYFDRTNELMFFRHLRNALAHGNRWHFRNGEPRQPAEFGPFILAAALHDREPVLFDYMSTGDVLDLLDHTAAHLRSLP